MEWYYTESGRLPAYEAYLDMPEEDQERLDMLVRCVADQPPGTRFPKTMYRVEDATRKIYAFKPRDGRFFNFMTAGRRIIITNAYRKHSQKMTKADLETLATAAVYKMDYIRRTALWTYYEDDA